MTAVPGASVGTCDKASCKAKSELEITGERASEGIGLGSIPDLFLLPGWSP